MCSCPLNWAKHFHLATVTWRLQHSSINFTFFFCHFLNKKKVELSQVGGIAAMPHTAFHTQILNAVEEDCYSHTPTLLPKTTTNHREKIWAWGKMQLPIIVIALELNSDHLFISKVHRSNGYQSLWEKSCLLNSLQLFCAACQKKISVFNWGFFWVQTHRTAVSTFTFLLTWSLHSHVVSSGASTTYKLNNIACSLHVISHLTSHILNTSGPTHRATPAPKSLNGIKVMVAVKIYSHKDAKLQRWAVAMYAEDY